MSEAFEWDTWPAYGNIVRAYIHYNFETNPHMQEPSSVRAVSASEAPETFETLSQATYRLAWLYGFALAVKNGNKEKIQAYEEASCKCPVRFELVPDQQAATVRKLQVDQDIKAKAETQGLYGYKLVRVYAQVQKQLMSMSMPAQYADVHKFLLQVTWTKADQPKLSSVAMHLKIHNRLTEHSIEALDLLETHFGKAHSLATITSLDSLSQKTFAKDGALSARLVGLSRFASSCHLISKNLILIKILCLRLWNWCVDGILIKHLRGHMNGQETCWLLNLRVANDKHHGSPYHSSA